MPVPVGDADDVLVLPDGSIVLGGMGDPEGDCVTKFALARLDAGGALVPEFGSVGGLVSRHRQVGHPAEVPGLQHDVPPFAPVQ